MEEMNDFVKPKDQRELAHFGLARNRTFKNDFVKPNEQSSSSLEYSAMARTFVQASSEPNLFGLCRAQPKMSKENCTFKNYSNPLYETLRLYPIVDLAPVYDKGVRGRIMSGRGSNWLLDKVREAGVKTIIDLRTADQTDRYCHNVMEAGMEYHSIPIDSKATDVHQIIASLPVLFELMDRGSFFMACAMGRHRTDIAIALYYVFHPTVPVDAIPEMKGHRHMERKEFRYDDIAARLNSVMKSMTIEERISLGLDAGYETVFTHRKKYLLEENRVFGQYL